MCTDSLSPTAEDDWNVVSVECGSLAAKWEQLSACLGLAKADIDRIRKNHPGDIAGCWSEALSQWIKQNFSTQQFGLPSWRSLLKAVAMVDRRLYMELAAKHPLGMTSQIKRDKMILALSLTTYPGVCIMRMACL